MNIMTPFQKLYVMTSPLSYLLFLVSNIFGLSVYDEILYFLTFAYSLAGIPLMICLDRGIKKGIQAGGIAAAVFGGCYCVLWLLSSLNGGGGERIPAAACILCGLVLLWSGVKAVVLLKYSGEFTVQPASGMMFHKIYTYIILPLTGVEVFFCTGTSFSSPLGFIWSVLLIAYILLIINTVRGLARKKRIGYVFNRIVLLCNPILVLTYLLCGMIAMSYQFTGSPDVLLNMYDAMKFVYPCVFFSAAVYEYYYKRRESFI